MGPFSVEASEVDNEDPPTEVDKIILEMMDVMKDQLKTELEKELKDEVRKEIYGGFFRPLGQLLDR